MHTSPAACNVLRRGIIAVVCSADQALRDAVAANDSSLLATQRLHQLATTTLSNWGAMLQRLGSAFSDDDSDDDEEDERSDNVGDNRLGADGVIVDVADDAAAAAGSTGEDSSGGGGGGDGGTSLQGGAAAETGAARTTTAAATQASTANAAADEAAPEQHSRVRVLDVRAALTSLAMTAGEQLTRNLQRWAPAAARLDLLPVLEHHARVAAAARGGTCAAGADPDLQEKDGNLGSCSSSSSGGGDGDGGGDDGGSVSSSGGGAGGDDGSSSSSSSGDDSRSSTSSTHDDKLPLVCSV